MKLLFDRLSTTLEHAMDFRLERGNMLTANLANVDTPGYTPVELRFDDQLADFLAGRNPPQIGRSDATHMGATQIAPEAEPEFDFFALPDADGNAVDLDHEMSKLAENQLLYRATTRVYNKRMAMLKYAIGEGQ